MSTTRIKICGITSAKDAKLAVEAGADYLGLIFAPSSPRCVSVETANAIIRDVGHAVKWVGVFQNHSLEEVQDYSTQSNLDLIQLHGEETPAYCEALSKPVIKAFVPVIPLLESDIAPYTALKSNSLYAALIDKPKNPLSNVSYEASIQVLSEFKQAIPRIFIAGQLTVQTVGPMIKEYAPYAVDVASGVESTPGIKDPQKLLAFCQAVRLATETRNPTSCNP